MTHDPWERLDALRRLHEHALALDIRKAVETVTGRMAAEIEAITSSPEFELARRTRNTDAFDERIAELRRAAQRELDKIAEATRTLRDSVESRLAEHREVGRFETVTGAEAAERGWSRARVLLDGGVPLGDVVQAALDDGDRELLAGVSANGPAWIRAQAGKELNSPGVKDAIADFTGIMWRVTEPYMSKAGVAYRAAATTYHRLAEQADAWIDFGYKVARGVDRPADRIELAFRVGDVPTAAEPRPSNELRGDVSDVLTSVSGPGIGTTQ